MKARNTKHEIRKFLILNFIFVICFGFLISNFGFPDKVMAQSISLSISPPLLEVMIQPGKEVKQTYTISNNSNDKILKPKIVYFVPSDLDGNVDITDSPAPDWVKFNPDQFTLKGEEQKSFNVIFSPPEGINETDHFLTLIFETAEPSNLGENNTAYYKTKIGTNILVTISKDGNPKKSAEIIEFSAPLVTDSLSPISYRLTLANNGNSFWKPIGKIIINDTETLKLAPQNILSGYSRKIGCLNDINLVECKLDKKFKIGKVVSKLEFTLEDDPKVYKSEIITYAIPFVHIGITLLLLTILRSKFIFKVWEKRN